MTIGQKILPVQTVIDSAEDSYKVIADDNFKDIPTELHAEIKNAFRALDSAMNKLHRL